MFDVGFWELALIAVVALLVVGPERLPRLARTAGMWVGRARRVIGSVKAEIDKELKAEELRQIMSEQEKSTGLHEIVEETRQVADDARSGLEEPAGGEAYKPDPAGARHRPEHGADEDKPSDER